MRIADFRDATVRERMEYNRTLELRNSRTPELLHG